MQKKSLILISGLVLITLVLVFFALQSQPQTVEKPQQQTLPPPVSTSAQTVLAIKPDELSLERSDSGTADVTIDTKDNHITAVQLELQYDPKELANVKVTAGDFLPQALTLINKTDSKAGRITFAIGISPTEQPVIGSGIVAHITFIKAKTATKDTTAITILSDSLVTSSGIDGSVLKSATGAKIVLK